MSPMQGVACLREARDGYPQDQRVSKTFDFPVQRLLGLAALTAEACSHALFAPLDCLYVAQSEAGLK